MARLRQMHPWNPGYSLPSNVMDEPYGQGVIITKQARRGTISALQPSYIVGGPGGMGCADPKLGSLGSAGGRGSIGGAAGGSLGSGGHGSLSGTVLDGNSLNNGVDLKGGGDPIASFGRSSAALIMSQVKALPVADRVNALRQILDTMEAGLFNKVGTRTAAIQKKTGAGAPTAMQQAIADLMAQHYLEQLKKLGRDRMPPRAGVLALMGDPDGLGGLWDTITGAASKVGGAAKTVGKGIAGLACKAAGSPALQAAAGAGGGAAGATGATLATQLCGGSSPATDTYVPPASTGPSMGTIALIGGGLLAAVLLLRK